MLLTVLEIPATLIEERTKQNTDDIRSIAITVVSVLGTIVFAGMCYWIGTISGKVDSLQIQNAAMEATITANKSASDVQKQGIDKDHTAFTSWLERIEEKVDKISEKVYSTR